MGKDALPIFLLCVGLGLGLAFAITKMTAPDAARIEAIHARNEHCAQLLAPIPPQPGCMERCQEDQKNFVCTNITVRDGAVSYQLR